MIEVSREVVDAWTLERNRLRERSERFEGTLREILQTPTITVIHRMAKSVLAVDGEVNGNAYDDSLSNWLDYTGWPSLY